MTGRHPDHVAQLVAAGKAWRFELPLTRPLSLNDRRHWQTKRREVASVRNSAHALARAVKVPPCRRITVELHYAPRDRRRRDADNLVATLKPIHDGLVDAGVIPDDTPEFLEPTFPVIDEPTGARFGRLYVLVIDLGADR